MNKGINAILVVVDILVDILLSATMKGVCALVVFVGWVWLIPGFFIWVGYYSDSVWGLVILLGPLTVAFILNEGVQRIWRHLQGEDDE